MRLSFILLLILFIYSNSNADDSNWTLGLGYQHQIWNTDIESYEMNNDSHSDDIITEINSDNDFVTINNVVGIILNYKVIPELSIGLVTGVTFTKNETIQVDGEQDIIDHVFISRNPGYYLSMNSVYTYQVNKEIKMTFAPQIFYGNNSTMHSIDYDNDLNSSDDEVLNEFLGWRAGIDGSYNFEFMEPFLGFELNNYYDKITFDGYLTDDFGSKDYFTRILNLNQSISFAGKIGAKILFSKTNYFVIESIVGKSFTISTKLIINL